MRFWQYLSLLVYIALYVVGWKLFFEIESFSYLKPFAYVWTASAFLCFFLAWIKGQFLFTGFFVGSILGPLAIIIILFSEKDLRCYKEEEKDARFYNLLYSKMEEAVFPLLKPEDDKRADKKQGAGNYAFDFPDMDFFIDCFKGKSGMRYKLYFRYQPPDLRSVLKDFKRMFIELNDEYKLKFRTGFGKVPEIIEKIDRKLSELERINASIMRLR